MKSNLILIFILCLSNFTFAQASLYNQLSEYFTNCINFDTKIYLQKSDSCIAATDLLSNEIILTPNQEIIIESLGYAPITTSLNSLDKTASCKFIYGYSSRNEISARRNYQSIRNVKYKCLDNPHLSVYKNVEQNIIGTYRYGENKFIVIEEEIIYAIDILANQYLISKGKYKIADDIISFSSAENYKWNFDSRILEKSKKVSDETTKIEICYLLRDCLQNHTNITITSMMWKKLDNENEIAEIINKIEKEN